MTVTTNSTILRGIFNITSIDGFNNTITSNIPLIIKTRDVNYFLPVHSLETFTKISTEYIKGFKIIYRTNPDYRIFVYPNSTIQIVRTKDSAIASAEKDIKRL